MGCCATGYVKSKSEDFIDNILENGLLNHYYYKELKSDLEIYYIKNTKKTANIIEAQGFIASKFLDSTSLNYGYQETILKDLLLLVYKSDRNDQASDVQSIYWPILLLFPILKEDLDNRKVDVNDKFSKLFQLIYLVCGGNKDVNYYDLKEKIPIYLKGLIHTIFKAVHTESKKHILSVDLSKDFEYYKKNIFTEQNVNSFIQEKFIKKNINVDDKELITKENIGLYLFNEMLFFSDLRQMFYDFVNLTKNPKGNSGI
jgi:hypothetical protein